VDRLRYKLSSLHIRAGVSVYPLLFLILVAILLGIYYSIGQTVQDELPEVLVSWYWLVSVFLRPVTYIVGYINNYFIAVLIALLWLYIIVYPIFRFVTERKGIASYISLLFLLLIVWQIYGKF
jgi:hypothetical protein